MTVENWDEFRTAYQVARLGTVSAAAEALGVHHATVIRHIDALETRLGVKLFQRHARGYTPTEAGDDLLRVTAATDDQLTQLVGRLKGQGEEVGGDLVITSISGLDSFVVPAMARLLEDYPALRISILSESRLFRLEYGEAHVAVRAGPEPKEPDNVVQSIGSVCAAAYASREYIDRHGRPEQLEDLADHQLVGVSGVLTRSPAWRWASENVPAEAFRIFCSDFNDMSQAVVAGMGIGIISTHQAQRYPDLLEIFPSRPEWSAPLWLVSHVDLHRTLKVQTALRYLKDQVKDWAAT